jgi:quinol monooxygenase YgiN
VPKYASYVRFTARPGQRDALIDLLLQAAESLSETDECELYVINASQDEEDAVWVTEIWESEAASRAALKVEGAAENIQKVLALLAERPEKVTLEVVGGKGL